MNAGPPENTEVTNKNSPLNTRMAESDLAPIRQAAEAANLNMSTVVRETLIRYGLRTIVELANDRDIQAAGAYQSSGKRRLRRTPRSKEVALADMVSWKFEIATDLARQWIVLGRITFDGTVVEDPDLKIPNDASERVLKTL
jgi:hypothetical protein